jgi:Family of unknown function (DUF5681)
MTGYKTGYGKPPINCQYKKGDRANPNGRRGKGAGNDFAAGDLLARLYAKKVEVEIGGKTKRLWRAEVTVNKLAKAALRGDLGAAELLIDLYNDSKSGKDFKCEPKYISEREAKIQRLSRPRTK